MRSIAKKPCEEVIITVRRWRTSVFTKKTSVFLFNFGFLSIDFGGDLEYNWYCDKIINLIRSKVIFYKGMVKHG